MTTPLIKILDKKQALTKKEVQEVEKTLREQEVLLATYTEDRTIDNKKQYFHGFHIAKFETYPQFIGSIHEQFGRGIEIQTYYSSDVNTMNLLIRGYAKELNR